MKLALLSFLCLAAVVNSKPQSIRRAQILPTISLGPYFNVGDGVITDIQHLPGDSTRLFVVTRNGRIHIVRNFATDDGSPMTKDPTPFLDLSNRGSYPTSSGGEQGLLGLAFDPNFAINGYFYVNYCLNALEHDRTTRISRFTVSGDANVADPSSELILETILQDNSNHNGGQLQFHSGYLYVGMGDGGGSGDPLNRALNPDSLLGKMLRFQVSNGLTGNDYQWVWTAAGSPSLSGAYNETIWSYGLRNPWRFSFDRDTDDLFVADVGQGTLEEVTWLSGGGSGGENYGWKYCEGVSSFTNDVVDTDCSGSTSSANLPDYVPPLLTYGRSVGISITGGYVYRGQHYPSLDGVYFYGDYGSNNKFIRGAFPTNSNDWASGVDPSYILYNTLPSGYQPTTFGEDNNGEIYVGFHNGQMAKIRGPATDSTAAPTSSSAPSEAPTVYPTRAPFSISVACPSTYKHTRSLTAELVLSYSIVPDPAGSSSTYGGLFCAELVHEGSGANQWLGTGVSACAPVDIDNQFCNKMEFSEVVVADPNDSSVAKYKLESNGANLMSGQTLLNATVTKDGTITTMSFSKYLKEPGEFEINPNGQNLFIYAIGMDNRDFPDSHLERGFLILDQTPCDEEECAGGQICELPDCETCDQCPENSCETTNGCTWNPGTFVCSGDTNSCSECNTEALCTQAGCEWKGKRCRGNQQIPSQEGTCTGVADPLYTCPPNLSCGDGSCDAGAGENSCNCALDCGGPPSTESQCTDGVDEDCDGDIDCDDSDCAGDAACDLCGNGSCDVVAGENSCNCAQDCGSPPLTEVQCTGGVDEDCDGSVDCDDSDCDGNAACSCVFPGDPCPSDPSTCCGGGCKGKPGSQTCK